MKPKHYEEVKIIERSGREWEISQARMYIHQARAARRYGHWHATLLQWAADCRRHAMPVIERGQLDLFA